MSRELQMAQEAACDQMALAATKSSSATYGKLLLRLTTMVMPGRLQSVLAPSINTAAGYALKQRLQTLRPATHNKAIAWMAIILVALVALPIRPVPQRPLVTDTLVDSNNVNNLEPIGGSSSEQSGSRQLKIETQSMASSAQVEVMQQNYRIRLAL
jgi:beta-lactamase regulating signal transducer with metallopeptidase domain